MRIAILEDEPLQQLRLQQALENQLMMGTTEVHCHAFSNGIALRQALRKETFDLLLMDWNVPGLDGLALVNWLRAYHNDHVPVLMLSSRTSEQDVAHALMSGVDDYIVKPFRPMELRARVLKLLDRTAVSTKLKVQSDRFGRWGFDRLEMSVLLYESAEPDAAVIERHALSSREFALARALFSNMGRAISRAYLLELAGYGVDDLGTRSLDSHIYRLRKKLGLETHRGVSLTTLYGQGYRLEDRASPRNL